MKKCCASSSVKHWRTLGYHVLSAANGRDALDVWAEHRDEIDLLLTDVVMPESISGRQLAHTLIHG